LTIVKKGKRFALLLVMLASVASGCMPRGAATNPGWTVVTAQNDVIYAALATGRVVALDATDGGKELWGYPPTKERAGGLGCAIARSDVDDAQTPLDAVYGIPVLTADLVLLTSFDQHLHAFERTTGHKVPGFGVDGAIVGGVTIYGDTAYFGSADHRVYALDVATRELVWDDPFSTENWVWSAPAVDEDRVYVGGMDHHVYAIDRATGSEVWKKDVGGSVPGAVTLSDGVLFAGGVDRRMHALNKDDGSELWRTEQLGGWVWGEALVHDGYVYFGSLDGMMHGLRVSDGSPRWEPALLDGAVRAGPALLEEYLIVGTEAGTMYTIEVETGEARKRFQAAGSVLSTPAVEGDMVYVGTTMGNVHAFDFSRGIEPEVWVYPPAKE
jgi:outer membrane protein assembly factor BamB